MAKRQSQAKKNSQARKRNQEKKKQEDKERKFTDRETGTYSGLVLSLRKYRDRLEMNPHYQLNRKPREVDVLIIDRLDKDEVMDNDIARMFGRHNIVELKNPKEPLNMDTLWKSISYACQYKSDKRSGEDVTITILRAAKPVKLLKELGEKYIVKNEYPGIYYIEGIIDLKIQIVVTSKLEGDEFAPLRIQQRKVDENDIKIFNEQIGDYDEQEKEYVEQILSYGLYGDYKAGLMEEDGMNKVFMSMMESIRAEKREIEAEKNELEAKNNELMAENDAKDKEISRLKELIKKNKIAML